MSDLKLTAEEVAWVKAYIKGRREQSLFCGDAAAKANAAARLAPAEPVVKESLTTDTPVAEPTDAEAAQAACDLCAQAVTSAFALREAETAMKPTTGETRTIEGDAVSARLRLDGREVSMSVLAMDEAIRGMSGGTNPPLMTYGNLCLRSNNSPQLGIDTVWLRGKVSEDDHWVAARTFDTPTAACAYFDSVCGLLTAFNASRAKAAESPNSSTPTLLEAAKAAQHYLTCGGSLADIDEALRAAIAREEASAGEPNHGRTKWRQIARDWQARAESATRDLAACREQCKAMESAAQFAERVRVDLHNLRDKMMGEVTTYQTHGLDYTTAIGYCWDKLAKDRDALRAQLAATEARVVAVEAERDALKQDVIRQATDIEKMAAAPSAPLAAVRKALKCSQYWAEPGTERQTFLNNFNNGNEDNPWAVVRRLTTEALRALDAATPAAQVVKAADDNAAWRFVEAYAEFQSQPWVSRSWRVSCEKFDLPLEGIGEVSATARALLAAKGEVGA